MDQEKSFNFESSLNELEKLVDALEHGDLNLEESLENFERGIHLTRSCQTALTDAQQKVKILLDNHDQPILQDYDNGNNKPKSSV
ncbi:MAG: exodeoxyribonuclease VII small subunit [Gammaproteobacteria bacterium]|nr:exodeoxyribonuclease VII small subunit [Gammaproteobacteria bacterium]